MIRSVELVLLLLASGTTFAAPVGLPALRELLVESPQTAIFSPAGFSRIAESIDSIDPSPHMERLHSEAGFQALVEGRPEARRALVRDIGAHPDALKGVKNAMYFSLARVMAAGQIPFADRVGAAASLAEGYAAFFDGLAAAPDRKIAAEAARAAESLRDPRRVTAPLAYERRLLDRWGDLEASVRRLRPAAERGAPGPSPWVVPPPLQTAAPSEARVTRIEAMGDLEGKLRDLTFGVEKLEARLRLVRRQSFSEAFRERVEREAGKWLDWVAGSLDYLKATVTRFSDVTIGRTFLDQPQHRITGIPDHPGLALVPQSGGFLIEARFKTDIGDPAIRDVVKRSIEGYWRGDFFFQGRRRHLRTRVTIEPLKPGEAFPKTWLRLVDAKEGMTHAGHTELALGRSPANFDYGVPAHEFGHVLGLDDQYREAFDPETWSLVESTVPGSLMGSRSGPVLERDLRLVYQLLRRRSQAPASRFLRWLFEAKRRLAARWRAAP